MPKDRAGSKKYNSACEICKRGKRRCDCGHPACGRCARLGLECIYLGNPSYNYAKRLENDVKRLSSTIAILQSGGVPPNGNAAHQPQASTSTITQTQRVASSTWNETSSSSPSSSSPRRRIPSDVAESSLRSRLAGKLVGDDRMGLAYHGTTSLYYFDSREDLLRDVDHETTHTPRSGETPSGSPEGSSSRTLGATSGREHDRLKESLSIFIFESGMSEFKPGVLQHFLDLHFTWAQHLFSFFYRPALGGHFDDSSAMVSYCSEFLLCALAAHIGRSGLGDFFDVLEDPTRWRPDVLSNPFGTKARALLPQELERGPSLSTCQGLVALSSFEAVLGRVSQAWAYSGMAFSLLEDLGVTIDRDHVEGQLRHEEEQEIRTRAFWSAYVLDKMLSLYYGRPPRLRKTSRSPRRVFADDPGERSALWSPYGTPNQQSFEPVLAHSIATFSSMCELAEVIEDILLFDHQDEISEADGTVLLATIAYKLDRWRQRTSAAIVIDLDQGDVGTPPPHVINLNCTFYVAHILLHQRSKTPAHAQRPYAVIGAALRVTTLAQLAQGLYHDRHAVLIHNYCCFTAVKALLLGLATKETVYDMTDFERTTAQIAVPWMLSRLEEASITVRALCRPLKVLGDLWQSIQEKTESAALQYEQTLFGGMSDFDWFTNVELWRMPSL